MKTKFVIGVDPGMSGAIAVLLPEEKKVWLISLSWSGQVGVSPLLNTVRLWNIFRQLNIDLTDAFFVCEHVHTFATDGIKSAAKFMAATSAVVNGLDTMRAAQHNADARNGIWRYEQPTVWATFLPQKWRAQIRNLVGESGTGRTAEATKNGSLRWFERLSKDWDIYTIVSHSNERATPVIGITPIISGGIKKRISADQREAFLIALAAIHAIQEKK